jgi:WD40 repeat protein
MLSVVRGCFVGTDHKEFKRSTPKKKMMVFVSSTFLDSSLERDVLHRKILRELQEMFRDVLIIIYDMRFGVKDENTIDHMTWISCREAIQQCYEESEGMFFLSLQADRYGYLPLPKYLEQDVLQKSIKDHENSDKIEEIREAVKRWYILDENNVPPRYELKNLSSMNDSEFWDNILPLLRDSLLDSVVFESCPSPSEESLLVNRSVTEWETLFGLSLDKERCYWIQRSFDKDALAAFRTEDWTKHCMLSDIWSNSSSEEPVQNRSVAKKLEILTAKMKSCLKDEQRCHLSSLVTPSDYFINNELQANYLKEWEKVTRTYFENDLQRVMEKVEEWKDQIQENIGISVDQFEEILFHYNNVFKKAEHFYGREELLEKAKAMMSNNDNIAGNIALALIGKSGCGKTTLMSKIAIDMSLNESDQPIPVIVRFCGTSQHSLNGLKLVQSISLQILTAYGQKQAMQNKAIVNILSGHSYKATVKLFHMLMLKFPVFLFLDSLDQLENRNEERSKLSFLRDIEPHPLSKIIVSSLPDEFEENGKPGKYFYQCEKTLKWAGVSILQVNDMNDWESTITRLLVSRRRTLTPQQFTVLFDVIRQEPTVLYINLALEVICHWRSFDREVMLRPTVKGIINQIFTGLEKDYGRQFVSIAFAMITFSREGINDIEMKDLLSLHEEVMKEVCQYSSLHCFPMHVWLRLKQVIKNLLAEKEQHCVKWYHRQLWESATVRYSEQKKECHLIMGRYFSNLIEINVKQEKEIHSQPLPFSDTLIWLPDCKVNRRRTIEGYYHLIKAGFCDEAVFEMCSLEFVCASGLCGDIFNYVRYLSELLNILAATNVQNTMVDHYFRWVRLKASLILSNPSWMVRSTAGEEPDESLVREAHKSLLSNDVVATNPDDAWGQCTIQTCNRLVGFNKIELELVGHSGWVQSVAWNNDGSKILSGSTDKTIKIWDSNIGELLNTFEGHTESVYSVIWSSDNANIISGSADKTVKIWNAETGELLNTLLGHESVVNSVACSRDDLLIASGSADTTIVVWDANTGELLKRLEGHSNYVDSVSWSPDNNNRKLISGSEDKTVKIWDAKNGSLLRSLEGHAGRVSSVDWSPDGTKIASGSADSSIRIWDPTTGEVLQTLLDSNPGEKYPSMVLSVSWDSESLRIASGSSDHSIQIWDGNRGTLLSSVNTNGWFVYCVSWNREGTKIVSGAWDTIIRICDGRSRRSSDTISSVVLQSSGSVRCVQVSHDRRNILSRAGDKRINIWDRITGNLLRGWEADENELGCVAYNSDSSKIASGTNQRIKIWLANTGELLKTFGEGVHPNTVYSLSWSSDDTKIVSAESIKTIFIWDANTGELLNTLAGIGANSVSWSPDNAKIASGSGTRYINQSQDSDGKTKEVEESEENVIKVWDPKNGDLLKTLEGHSDVVTCVAWSPDSTKIVSGSKDASIKVWDANIGELLATLKGHSGKVESVFFWSSDQTKSMIVSSSVDETIKVWDGDTGRLITTLIGHAMMNCVVVFHDDNTDNDMLSGDVIVSGSSDGNVKIWKPASWR